jgi:hypothetical protein
MSDTEVESLNTVSPLSFVDIVANIKDSAQECAQSEDYISFSTVLDIYLNDWNVYSCDECMELMELICSCLNDNKEMLAEIAWDLPSLLLPFIECDWPVTFALRDAKQVSLIYKVFNLLAEYGEPKGLLLTCTEQLKNLEDVNTSDEIDDEEVQAAKKRLTSEQLDSIDDLNHMIESSLKNGPKRNAVLKFNCLFQCIKFSFQRIKTVYPSKFLSLIISAILSFTNSCPEISGELAVLRSMYLFIRDYNPPDVPENIFAEQSSEDLEKVFEDESYLQGKLMRLLLDNIVERMGRNHFTGMLYKILPSWSTSAALETISPFYVLMDRLLTMTLSMDIDLRDSFRHEANQTIIFDNNIELINTSEDIIKLVVAYYNTTSFRAKDPSRLPGSPSSIITLYTYARFSEHWSLDLPEAEDALKLIKMQLMLYIPYVVDSKLVNMTAVSFYLILTILAIESKKRIASPQQLQDKKIRLIISTYLQNIASVISNFLASTTAPRVMIKRLYSRFLKQMLQHLPEDMAYDYIIDTLESCPFEYNVSCVILIYKNLVSTSQYDDEKLATDLSKLQLDAKDESVSASGSSRLAPPLPKRDNYSRSSFIEFTPERQKKLFELMKGCVDETFKSSSEATATTTETTTTTKVTATHIEVDLIKANRLLNYLSFLNTLVFKDSDKILSLLDLIRSSVKDAESNLQEREDTQSMRSVLKAISMSSETAGNLYRNTL